LGLAPPRTVTLTTVHDHREGDPPMAERSRTRRNTLERRCLGKSFKRLFVGAPKGVFKMLEKIKKA
jgi:hypothetical protein